MNRNLPQSTASRGGRYVVLGVLLTLLSVAGAAAQTGAFELRAGVVVDPQAGAIYLMSPQGGLDAVDLRSGNVRWHSDAAARPISASAAGILAQAESSEPGSLELVLLDRSGRVVRTARAALPPDVKATVVDELGHRFTARSAATGVGGQSFAIAWEAVTLAPRGALIADRRTAPTTHRGLIAFEPMSGTVNAIPAPGPLAAPAVVVPAAQRLAVPGNQYFSADGAHRLASDPRPGATESYEWTFYDAGGSPLGSFSSRFPFARFYVGDGLVVHESPPGAWRDGEEMVERPLSLSGVSLANGVELWSLPLRDTEYRGPFPP